MLIKRFHTQGCAKAELLNELKSDLEGLIRELKDDLMVSARSVAEHNINASKLRVDGWNRLQQIRTPHERKIRWFLIKSEQGLEEDLTKLYKNIAKYNDSIEGLMFLGDLRTPKDFRSINREREDLHSDIEKMRERLSRLHRLSTS